MKKIKKIQYASLSANLKPVRNLVLKDENDCEELKITDSNFSGKNFEHLNFYGCEVKDSSFSQSKIADVRFSNNRFEDCDLANLKLEKALVEQAEFIKCRMTGFKAIEGSFKNVIFKNSQLKLSQFRLCKFKNVTFENCLLEEADFYGSDLSGTIFVGSDLTKAEMSATRLGGADFRTSKIAGLNVNIESLKNAIIEPAQVNDLAWLLGTKIEWK